MAPSHSEHEYKAEVLIINMIKKVKPMLKTHDEEQIKEEVREEIANLLIRIINGQIKISVSYEDPNPILHRCFNDPIISTMVNSRLDYQPNLPELLRVKHFSDWMLNIYLGNFTEFMKMISSMNEQELKQHLNMRETAMQFGAVFHVVLGAHICFSGHPKCLFYKAAHSRVEAKHLKILEKLLELGADVNSCDIAGREALFYCASADPLMQELATAMAKLLLKHGASVNPNKRMKHIVLATSATLNHGDVVKLLIKHGANPHLKTDMGMSPFDYALTAEAYKLISHMMLFDKKEILQEQKKAIEEQDYKKCGVCRSISSKRCAGCQMEWYCSVDCQKQHWVEHGSICQEKQAEYFPVMFVPDDSAASTVPDKIVTVVSIQLYQPVSMEMNIYDQQLRIRGSMSSLCSNSANFMDIVKKQGFKGFKGFFNAKKDGKQLKIHPKILPPQLW